MMILSFGPHIQYSEKIKVETGPFFPESSIVFRLYPYAHIFPGCNGKTWHAQASGLNPLT